MRFKVRVYEGTGEAYQDLFSLIMELNHPGDFVRIRPWGNVGDKKNDGYHRSQRHLYQVYAPNELSAKDAIDKINTDFHGALPHWQEHFDKWSFAHNSFRGLGPDVELTLLDIERNHPHITISHLGPVELRTKLFSLQDQDIYLVLGPPPAIQPNQITFEEISNALAALDLSSYDATAPVVEVPADKLDINRFDDNTRALVRFGSRLSPRVTAFLTSNLLDPELGSRIAFALRYEYSRLKQSGEEPNNIYRKLFEFVNKHQASSETASYAILSYFFERCDIFEAVV